jgi:hypothetical protein
VLRDDSRNADLMMQASVTTYQAYNNWGGKSLYGFNSSNNQPASKVSFNRPYADLYADPYEVRMVRFLEREGYDVVYSTSIDTHTSGNQLTRFKGFLSVGHDEYWTKQMRDAVESARGNGINLGFFGANTSYWQIRLEPSNTTGDANRTVVGYKSAALDPLTSVNPAEASVRFRDAPLNRPEASLVGVMYDYDPVNADIVISNCIPWICSGTTLVNGSHLTGMLGYEVDRVDPSSPANIQIIATSPYQAGTETRYSNMTFYQAASGAKIFATGSMNWNMGLDQSTLVNPAVQQITRNVLNSFIPAPPLAPASSPLSVKALDNNRTSAANGGGCVINNRAGQRLDISLLFLLATNLLWRWKGRKLHKLKLH